jgi:hypothetical protein
MFSDSLFAVKHATGELLLLPLLRSLLRVLQVLLLGVVNKQALPLSRILVVYISCCQTSSFLSYVTSSLNTSVGRDTLVVWNKSRDRNAGDPLHGKKIMVYLMYLDEVDTPVLEKLSIGTKTLFGRDIYIGRKPHRGTISHVEINTPTPMNQRATCEGIFCGITRGGVGTTHNWETSKRTVLRPNHELGLSRRSIPWYAEDVEYSRHGWAKVWRSGNGVIVGPTFPFLTSVGPFFFSSTISLIARVEG